MRGVREEVISAVIEEKLAKLTVTSQERAYFASAIAELKEKWFAEREQQISTLSLHLQQSSERLNRLTDAYLDEAIDRDLYEQRKASLLAEKRGIEDQLQDWKSGRRSIPEEVQKFLELAGSAYSLYKGAFPEKRRRLLKMVTSNLSVDQTSIDFAYANPFDLIANRHECTAGGPYPDRHRTVPQWVVLLHDAIASSAEQISAWAKAFLDTEEDVDDTEGEDTEGFTYVPIPPETDPSY